ncbi:MAG: glycosyltransferase family 9 protein [Candidatus Omnitrophica bacterium]|nr:glycosyltransferase family 9 protein [Candidatus Omnitrophota bacterium]
MTKKKDYKNILVVRTDRIGDVVLTTPAIQALREAFPNARISILVTSQTRAIVDSNPYLDEVIVYDSKGKDRGFFRFWSLVFKLMKKHFDLAINYHIKNRTNALLFHACIPCRAGFENIKLGFLLNHTIPDSRIQGIKHESEYCLDILKSLGINIEKKYPLHVSIQKESEEWVEKLFLENNILLKDKVVAVHPGASCISRRWSPKRFSQVIDQIAAKHKTKIILIGSDDNQRIAREVIIGTSTPVVDLTGKTSLSQLISLLKRCCLLISNDSGPGHLAAGVGTPVVSIFSRNQPGLSATRWRSLGEKDIFFHKDVGCIQCVAHDCQKGFQCLNAVQVHEVVGAADQILNECINSGI